MNSSEIATYSEQLQQTKDTVEKLVTQLYQATAPYVTALATTIVAQAEELSIYRKLEHVIRDESVTQKDVDEAINKLTEFRARLSASLEKSAT